MVRQKSTSISNNNYGDEVFPTFCISRTSTRKSASPTPHASMDSTTSTNTSAAPSRTDTPASAGTPASLSAPTAAGDRRPSGYDSAPAQVINDKEREHQSTIKKLLSNKLAPSFLK